MIDVKNENIAVLNADVSESAETSKPLELLTLRVLGKNSDTTGAAQEPAAAAGSDRPESRDPVVTRESDIPLAVGVIATALMLTYGNVLMEILFRMFGI